MEAFAGVDPVTPRAAFELGDLIRWLETGAPAAGRLDFTAGTAMPDGRLDLCKQALGPHGATLVTEALRPGQIRHLLLGTDGLGDAGADTVSQRASSAELETLYLGCNGITATGACRLADNLLASPQVLSGLWVKRNPLGPAGAEAVTGLVSGLETLRTLDLVQTGIDAGATDALVRALLAASDRGKGVERLYIGGNRLGPSGGAALAPLIASGAVSELYASASWLGDRGAEALTHALKAAPYGRLKRLSLASNGIGPQASARVVAAAVATGVEVFDLGRVKAANALAAPDNRIDGAAAASIGRALSNAPHRLTHLVLANTGMRSREAQRLLDFAVHAPTPTRYLLGKGIAASIRARLNSLCERVPHRPAANADIKAVTSLHRSRRAR
ncbi:leucine-rich repeat domain-containing protein [Glycomyces halotolerans]